MAKFLCICLSSTIQRSINFENLALTKVNRSKKYRIDASGKAVNSARVLSMMEKNCAKVLCPLGKENSALFVDLLKKDNVELSYIEIPGFTRECWTLLDTAAGTTTELVVSEPAENLCDGIALSAQEAAALEEIFLNNLKKLMSDCDAVLLAGSKPAVWSKNLYPKIAEIVNAAGKTFLADYWAEDLLNTISVAVPSIIKINDEEFCKTFGLEFSENAEEGGVYEKSLQEAICKKSAELNNIIIVTRGTKSTFAAKNGEFYSCPCQKVKAINTTACGDSFNSGFFWEYMNSGDFAKALEKGTWAAAQNAQCECPGALVTAVVTEQ